MAKWKALLMGDSQINGRIGKNLEGYLKKHDWQILRKGKDGSRADDWLGKSKRSSFNSTTVAYLKEGIEFKPDLIFVNLGGNNLSGLATANKENAKELAQKLLTETEATIIWLGPPPYTLPNLSKNSRRANEGATIINGQVVTSNVRYIKAGQIAEALTGLSLYGSRLRYVDPCKDWETYVPVYATLPSNVKNKSKWTGDGVHVGEYGSLEYINNMVLNWKSSVFPADPN